MCYGPDWLVIQRCVFCHLFYIKNLLYKVSLKCHKVDSNWKLQEDMVLHEPHWPVMAAMKLILENVVYFADHLAIWPPPPPSKVAAKEATLNGGLMWARAVGSDVRAHPYHTDLFSRHDKLRAVAALHQLQWEEGSLAYMCSDWAHSCLTHGLLLWGDL